jgi:hypothetical protein
MARWIASNAASYTIWHLGRRREARGARTGRLLHTYFVTACSGKQLGGCWGQTERDSEQPPSDDVCKRCAFFAKGVE